MPAPELSQAESDRLIEVADKLDYNFSIALKEHFNQAGKMSDLEAATTPEDIEAQKQCLRDIFNAASDAEAAYAGLKTLDIMLDTALRVSTEAEIAACLPAANDFDQADIDLLDKCGLNAVSKVIKARPAP